MLGNLIMYKYTILKFTGMLMKVCSTQLVLPYLSAYAEWWSLSIKKYASKLGIISQNLNLWG